jgi:hypothetical protein
VGETGGMEARQASKQLRKIGPELPQTDLNIVDDTSSEASVDPLQPGQHKHQLGAHRVVNEHVDQADDMRQTQSSRCEQDLKLCIGKGERPRRAQVVHFEDARLALERDEFDAARLSPGR